jgi:hypothetical protein
MPRPKTPKPPTRAEWVRVDDVDPVVEGIGYANGAWWLLYSVVVESPKTKERRRTLVRGRSARFGSGDLPERVWGEARMIAAILDTVWEPARALAGIANHWDHLPPSLRPKEER